MDERDNRQDEGAGGVKLLLSEEDMAVDIRSTLRLVGLKAETEAGMVGEVGLLDFEGAKQLKRRAESALFDLAYPLGHAAYTGDHRTGQMLSGRQYLLEAILWHLEERL